MMAAGLFGWIYYPRIAEFEEKRREEKKLAMELERQTVTTATETRHDEAL